MQTDKNSKVAVLSAATDQVSDSAVGMFVPVAIPARFEDAEYLKANLQSSSIPVRLEDDVSSGQMQSHHGVPVLVPECRLEQASEIVGCAELDQANDEFDDVEEFDDGDEDDEEDEFDDLEDEEDEFDDDDEDDDIDFGDDDDDDDDNGDDDFFHNGDHEE